MAALWLAEFADDDSDLRKWSLKGGAIKQYRAIAAALASMLMRGKLQRSRPGKISDEGFSDRAWREAGEELARDKCDEHIAYAVAVETESAKTARGAQAKIAVGRGKHRSTVHRALKRTEQKEAMRGLMEKLKKQKDNE